MSSENNKEDNEWNSELIRMSASNQYAIVLMEAESEWLAFCPPGPERPSYSVALSRDILLKIFMPESPLSPILVCLWINREIDSKTIGVLQRECFKVAGCLIGMTDAFLLRCNPSVSETK